MLKQVQHDVGGTGLDRREKCRTIQHDAGGTGIDWRERCRTKGRRPERSGGRVTMKGDVGDRQRGLRRGSRPRDSAGRKS